MNPLYPSELYFCVHSALEAEGCSEKYDDDDEYKNLNVITFCPILYWKENKCLPDYYFGNQINDSFLPEGYSWYICVEETQWATKKSKQEIVIELTSLGFSQNKEMERFLSDCWS